MARGDEQYLRLTIAVDAPRKGRDLYEFVHAAGFEGMSAGFRDNVHCLSPLPNRDLTGRGVLRSRTVPKARREAVEKIGVWHQGQRVGAPGRPRLQVVQIEGDGNKDMDTLHQCALNDGAERTALFKAWFPERRVCGGVTGSGLPAPGKGACLSGEPRNPDKNIHVHGLHIGCE